MATDLGKVGIVLKGNWSNSATYQILDAVTYNGCLYIAKQAVPANTTPTNTTYWQAATVSPVYTVFDYPIEGIVCNSGYADVQTTIPTSSYYPIAVLDGAQWEDKLVFSVTYGSGRVKLHIRTLTSSTYTIPARSPVKIVCVNAAFVTTADLPS